MSNDALILTVGLTDVTDGDYAVMGDHQSEDSEHYNLYKQSPEIEKTSISWKLNMDVPAVVSIINQWEKDIRRPHLSMINIGNRPHPLNKDFSSFSVGINVVNLLPDFTNTIKIFTLAELYDSLQCDVPWGALSIGLEEIYRFNAINNLVVDLHYAMDVDNTASIKEFNTNDNLEMPTKLWSNFALEPRKRPKKLKSFSELDDWLIRFYDDHESELLELGYTKDVMIQLCGNDQIIVGTLTETPSVVYEKIKENPRICRTSLTKEE